MSNDIASSKVPRPPEDVIVINLDIEADEILALPFSEYQRAQAARHPGGTVDASRVIAIGPCFFSDRSAGALDKIVAAESVRKVLCVLRGPLGPGARHEVALPAALNLASVATMWVEDPRGVLWDLNSTKAKALAVCDDDPRGAHAFSLLIACLRLPEVFDDVFVKVKGTGKPASPALRLFVPGTTDRELVRTAEEAVVTAVSTDGYPEQAARTQGDVTAMELHSELFGSKAVPADLFDRTGQIGSLASEVERRSTLAAATAQSITDRPPLTHDVVRTTTDAMRMVGASLRALKSRLVDDFTAIDGSNGLTSDEVRRLQLMGLRADETVRGDADLGRDREESLRALAIARLRRTSSLRQVAADLRDTERRARPRPAGATLAKLEKACPQTLVDRLSSYPELRVGWGNWPTVALFFCLFFASGFMPGFWVVLPPLLLGLVALIMTAVTHPLGDLRALLRRDKRQAAEKEARRTVVSAQVGVNAVVAIIGFVAGIEVSRAHPSTALHVIAALVAVAILVVLALYPWQRSSKKWLADADLEEALTASQALMDVASDVALNDWVWANPRVRFSSIAGKLASCLEDLRASLQQDQVARGGLADAEEGEATGNDSDALTLRCNPAIREDLSAGGESSPYQHDTSLEAIVHRDYIELIADVITAQWPIIVGMEKSIVVPRVLGVWADRINEYRQDLLRVGLFGMQGGVGDRSSADVSQQRQELLGGLWEGANLDGLVGISLDDDLVQLCSPESLSVLDQNTDHAALTIFAPMSSKVQVGGADIVRTASLLMAGAVRLVPMRLPVRWGRPDDEHGAGNNLEVQLV